MPGSCRTQIPGQGWRQRPKPGLKPLAPYTRLTCLGRETKLVPSFLVADRSAGAAYDFMKDIASHLRIACNSRRTAYLAAVEDAFAADIDYATLTKLYGADPADDRRYSPPIASGANRRLSGITDPKHISTS